MAKSFKLPLAPSVLVFPNTPFLISNPFLTLAPKIVQAFLKNRPEKLFSNCLVDGLLTSQVQKRAFFVDFLCRKRLTFVLTVDCLIFVSYSPRQIV